MPSSLPSSQQPTADEREQDVIVTISRAQSVSVTSTWSDQRLPNNAFPLSGHIVGFSENVSYRSMVNYQEGPPIDVKAVVGNLSNKSIPSVTRLAAQDRTVQQAGYASVWRVHNDKRVDVHNIQEIIPVLNHYLQPVVVIGTQRSPDRKIAQFRLSESIQTGAFRACSDEAVLNRYPSIVRLHCGYQAREYLVHFHFADRFSKWREEVCRAIFPPRWSLDHCSHIS